MHRLGKRFITEKNVVMPQAVISLQNNIAYSWLPAQRNQYYHLPELTRVHEFKGFRPFLGAQFQRFILVHTISPIFELLLYTQKQHWCFPINSHISPLISSFATFFLEHPYDISSTKYLSSSTFIPQILFFPEMSFSAIEPFFAASARGYKRTLTLFSFKRFQACFGWAKNGSSLGYGAWLKYTKRGGKTVTISMLLGVLPVYQNSLQSAANSALDTSSKPQKSIGNPLRTSKNHQTDLPPLSAPRVKSRSNLQILFRQPWLLFFLFFRCIKLGLVFFPLLLMYPLMRGIPQLKLVWLHFLLKAIESSGPTFMKFGQWMSTRRDIFSPELCGVLGTLHRRAPPHSFSHTRSELDRWVLRSFLVGKAFLEKLNSSR